MNNKEETKEPKDKYSSVLDKMTQNEFKIGDKVYTEEQLLMFLNCLPKD